MREIGPLVHCPNRGLVHPGFAVVLNSALVHCIYAIHDQHKSGHLTFGRTAHTYMYVEIDRKRSRAVNGLGVCDGSTSRLDPFKTPFVAEIESSLFYYGMTLYSKPNIQPILNQHPCMPLSCPAHFSPSNSP